jgi:serine/threonine-protein kinase
LTLLDERCEPVACMPDELVHAAAPDPNVGRVVAGRYSILRRLGGGGMGVVYLAEHSALQKRVALKLLHTQYATDPDVVQRFLNEARAAARIGHRNIVDALDFGQAEDGAPFLVLEYLEGRDLAHELESQGRVSVRRAAQVGLQIAAGLGAAHRKGIVHRDLKPDNVFLVEGEPPDSAVRILDFGISKIAQAGSSAGGTKTGAVMGTPSYMSPEQFLDASRVDARCDVYALGVLLFQMLTGRLPFSAPSFGALAVVVMQEKAPSVALSRPDLPPALVALVDSMLAKDPTHRPAGMAEVEAVLAPLARDGADVVPDLPPTVVPEVTVTPAPSNAGIAASNPRGTSAAVSVSREGAARAWLVVAAILGVLVLGGLAWAGLRAPEEPVAPPRTVATSEPVPPVLAGDPRPPTASDPEPPALPMGAVPPETTELVSDDAGVALVPDAVEANGSTERVPATRRRPSTPATPPAPAPAEDAPTGPSPTTTMETAPVRPGPSRRLDDENPY